MKRLHLGSAVAAAPLAGCVTPSSQISAALTRYGLDAQQAVCVGSDLSFRLSIARSQQLGRAARAYRRNNNDPTHLIGSDLLRVATQLNDPAAPLAVAGAGLRCGVAAGGR